jgi:transcription initiation factor TFIIA large subunit
MASNYHQMDTPPMPQSQPTFQLPPLPPMQPMNGNANEPRIKSEPGVENGLNLPSYNAPSTGLTAQQRAAQNLQATYGARAAASINAIQGNLPQQSQQQTHQQNMQQQQQQQRHAGPPIQRPQMSTAQYQQAMAEAAARQRAQIQPTGNAQTDGADEIDGESYGIVKHVDSAGQEVEMGRVEIDTMIRQRIEAMGKRMEGGGLMLPLKKRATVAPIKKRKDVSAGHSGSNAGLNPVPNDLSSSYAPAQFDGGDEDDDSDDKANVIKDEDLDEDAINSDLDDPDDGLNEDEDDDEAMGHIMLCMYDKVQRVKNKWFVFTI